MLGRDLSSRGAVSQVGLAGRDAPGSLDDDADQRSLFSVVAHELRAPVQALVDGAECLVEQVEAADPRQIRDMVAAIHRGTLGMRELVENLLCVASIDAGRFQLQRRPIRLLDVLAEVEPTVAPILHQREQTLRVTVRGRASWVSADRRRLGQVLANLISNASRFGPAGQPIDLLVRTMADVVRVTVADRGPGFPPGRHTRLFEPFERRYPTFRCGDDGLGLGLAVVRTVVRLHGGRVGAGNRRGGGAAVWFELPLAQGPRLLQAKPD